MKGGVVDKSNGCVGIHSSTITTAPYGAKTARGWQRREDRCWFNFGKHQGYFASPQPIGRVITSAKDLPMQYSTVVTSGTTIGVLENVRRVREPTTKFNLKFCRTWRCRTIPTNDASEHNQQAHGSAADYTAAQHRPFRKALFPARSKRPCSENSCKTWKEKCRKSRCERFFVGI